MSGFASKAFDSPDETRTPPKTKVDVVRIFARPERGGVNLVPLRVAPSTRHKVGIPLGSIGDTPDATVLGTPTEAEEQPLCSLGRHVEPVADHPPGTGQRAPADGAHLPRRVGHVVSGAPL
ncbi:hypothetical protein BH23CHL7_BH23CHL7_18280 [soil metagenome]